MNVAAKSYLHVVTHTRTQEHTINVKQQHEIYNEVSKLRCDANTLQTKVFCLPNKQYDYTKRSISITVKWSSYGILNIVEVHVISIRGLIQNLNLGSAR